MFTRGTERAEFEADTMADEFRFYGGGEPEDPMSGVRGTSSTSLACAGRALGMEVPGGYLQPQHYVAVKAMLGEALVQDGTGLVAALRAVKSPAELTYIRRAAEISAIGWHALLDAVAEGRSELELVRRRLSGAAEQRQRAAGEHHEPDDRRTQRLRPRWSDRP